MNIELWCGAFAWPKPGGAMGLSAIFSNGKTTAEISKGCAPLPSNCNNRAELGAIILGLQHFASTKIIFSDSKYAVDGLTSWRAGERHDRVNADLRR